MRTTNNNQRVVRLVPSKRISAKTMLMLFVAAVFLAVTAGVFKGWISLPLPEDAGPTQLTAYERVTQIERRDLLCNASVTSTFVVSGFNPGYKFGWFGGGEAYMFFDIVGDLDLCIRAADYTLSIDEPGKNIVVDVSRIEINRPRLDLNPRVLGGVTYQTLKLSSLSKDKLADANLDRVVWEAIRNIASGNDDTYINEMQEQLLSFGAEELARTACYPQAIKAMEQGVYEHFLVWAELVGLEGVTVNLPNDVVVPQAREDLDTGLTVLSVSSEETCFVDSEEA